MRELAEFIEERWSDWYRLAYLLAGASGQADDILQESMAKLVNAWDRVAAVEDPDAYVRRILTNTTIDLYRSKVRTSASARFDNSAEDPPGRAAFEDRTIQRADLWPHIAELPVRQRAIIVLRYYEDLSELQIAAVLGCAPGTVKSQASAALRKLRESVFVSKNRGQE